MARGNLAARAVDCAGEALHQEIVFSERSAPGGVCLDEQGAGQGWLVGAELEQLGHAGSQALAPGRLALGGADKAPVEPLAASR